MLNSVCLVYIGIINRSYINNYYCKDYIYKQKKLKLFVCKKERKINFFRIAKKKTPYYFKLLGNLTQLIKKNQKKQSCLYGNTFHFIQARVYNRESCNIKT